MHVTHATTLAFWSAAVLCRFLRKTKRKRMRKIAASPSPYS
jgi:hypothetical protein